MLKLIINVARFLKTKKEEVGIAPDTLLFRGIKKRNDVLLRVIDYNAENQNWAISQSDDKFIYVANNSGLLEFNGAEWKLYPSPNNATLRYVSVIDAKIYTGGYMEFGYWFLVIGYW